MINLCVPRVTITEHSSEGISIELTGKTRNRAINGFIFDLDGTVYLGEEALPGSVAGIATLREQGKQVLFVTNKPLEPRAAYAAKLTRLGIPTEPEAVITSAHVLGRHLAQHAADLPLYVIGEAPLRAELRGHGLHVLEELADQDPTAVIDPQSIGAVVVAFDRTLDYRKLNTAYQALLRGVPFYATNADNACPMPGGSIPDAGGTIAALEQMTGRKLELLAGKPSHLTMEIAMAELALPAEQIMMVGDRLETDILMGQQAGMPTAVTLTGVATRAAVAAMAHPPDYVIENLGELPTLLARREHEAER